MKIRKVKTSDLKRVLDINMAAFRSIHESFEKILGKQIFELAYPDWRSSNKSYIESLILHSPHDHFYVVEVGGVLVGFIHFTIDKESGSGEIGLNAVDPESQGKGVGRAMYEFALDTMRRSGVKMAVVGTGADDSHTAARKAYESCGFKELPLSRYYLKL